ncbi:MAG: hypothetical protein GX591_04250 [Planctomycetes bacterium]|nr:hypothetical protein [Planctomycetota bacterium]
MADRFSNVMQFLGSYFHQDWLLEAGSADDVLEQYVGDESRSVRLQVAADIDELLGADDSVVSGL